MTNATYFEIYADDPARAAKFYGGVFGWEIRRREDGNYWMLRTEKRALGMGKIIPRVTSYVEQGGQRYACTIDVGDLDEAEDKILDAGGMNVIPKMSLKGVGWMAYFRDTEGNLFGLMQPDEVREPKED